MAIAFLIKRTISQVSKSNPGRVKVMVPANGRLRPFWANGSSLALFSAAQQTAKPGAKQRHLASGFSAVIDEHDLNQALQ